MLLSSIRRLRQIFPPSSDDLSRPRDYHVQHRLLQLSTGWSASVDYCSAIAARLVFELGPKTQKTHRTVSNSIMNSTVN